MSPAVNFAVWTHGGSESSGWKVLNSLKFHSIQGWDLVFPSLLFHLVPPRLWAEERAQEEKENHQHHFLWWRSGRRGWGWGRGRGGPSEDGRDEEEPHSSRSEQCGGRNRSFRTGLLRVAGPERYGWAWHRQLGGVPPSLPNSTCNSSSSAWH